MAEKRFVNTMIWKEDYFQTLDETGKLIYLYLITNSDIEYYGVLPYNIPKIAHEIGVTEADVSRILSKLKRNEQIIIDEFMIFIRGFMKRQGNRLSSRTRARPSSNGYKLPPKILARFCRKLSLNAGTALLLLGFAAVMVRRKR